MSRRAGYLLTHSRTWTWSALGCACVFPPCGRARYLSAYRLEVSPWTPVAGFFVRAPATLLALTAACRGQTEQAPAATASSSQSTPGAPTTFASGPETGPVVSPDTFVEAEKLVQVTLSQPDRGNGRRQLAAIHGPLPRAPRRPSQGRSGSERGTGDTMEPDLTRADGRSHTRRIRSKPRRSRATPERRR